jgi:predicted RNase H-like HicB family nuclease
MPSVRRYLAVADQAPGESAFSITFPALPGLTSVALCDADIESQARDALATVAEAFLEDGEALPPGIEGDALPAFDRIGLHDTRGFLVAVDTGNRG